MDCSPASIVTIPKVPTPKCGTIPESGTYEVSHSGTIKGPIPLGVGSTHTQGNIQVDECGKAFLFLQGGQQAKFKRTHVSQEGKSHYESIIGQLRFALDALTNTTLVGTISGGMFQRDYKMEAVVKIPPEKSESIKKCFCSEVKDHLKQRIGDQRIHQEELKKGKPMSGGPRVAWGKDEGMQYQKQVAQVISTTNRPQSFAKMVENQPGKAAGMLTEWETCHIETFEKKWE
ncbi:MAG: hypothetical protein R3257_07375, partial [bacterium]|nr:hypothetical protein [bacterium]